jgi:hypothetical protein
VDSVPSPLTNSLAIREGETAMGLFNKVFGKKVEVTLTDKDGISRTKQILKSDLNKWERDGKLSRMKTIKANVAGLSGVRTEKWTIGIDVPKESVDKYADKLTGELYVGEHNEKGEPIQYLMMKDAWEDYKNT